MSCDANKYKCNVDDVSPLFPLHLSSSVSLSHALATTTLTFHATSHTRAALTNCALNMHVPTIWQCGFKRTMEDHVEAHLEGKGKKPKIFVQLEYKLMQLVHHTTALESPKAWNKPQT